MFAYLRGNIEYVKDNHIIVDVNGVGYKVHTSASTIERLPPLHQQVKVYTYLYIKEDAMDLYGFVDEEELSMFELLISVSGVGPKAALAILSTTSPSKFALAVVGSDVKTITRAPGIGNKLAQRIILELKDKIKSEDLISLKGEEETFTGQPNYSSEAVHALVVLGYSFAEATRAVQSVKGEGLEVEEIVKQALKNSLK
ncbi:MAG: holliday junction helicase RuvA [Petroclostridium sp.]|uniref:Holliday junction branch migration protein RuvA n=1 Tax=Petroclostridium xylanilyticum TaxID=1792311 RepID=UPI000B97F7DB|nr:Holliday junction branch migration protein RuvA [Petroclostridium xylanilyticum]MBZ4645530.1 Holliday junction helicase subunit RuvA [Clostridia bacterium]MDK2811262.1 holliday junction helicase RuvA [Petroclostridium sp.]